MLRLDRTDHITNLHADECATVRRLNAVRHAFRSMDPSAVFFLLLITGAMNFTWILGYLDRSELDLSLLWKVVISLAVGPVALLGFNVIAMDSEMHLERKKRSQLLYQFPHPATQHSTELMEKAREVTIVAKSFGRKVGPVLGKAVVPWEQIDAVTNQLFVLVDLLAASRGPAGHNPLAEEAALLGDAVPDSAAHMPVEHNEWLASLPQWETDYKRSMEVLHRAVDVFDFSIRLAQAEQSKK